MSFSTFSLPVLGKSRKTDTAIYTAVCALSSAISYPITFAVASWLIPPCCQKSLDLLTGAASLTLFGAVLPATCGLYAYATYNKRVQREKLNLK